MLSGVVFVNENGLRWRDARSAYVLTKTLYIRRKRRRAAGVFARMLSEATTAAAEAGSVMIDASCLKAHRTASSLRVKKGISAA